MLFKEKKNQNEDFIDICALLIHAAKIDEDYSDEEKQIIRKTLLLIGVNKEDVENILLKGEAIEKDSNQILNFTKKVKNMNEKDKIKIIEALWQIIYSNDKADIYETNLMRRLAGLLYIDNKIMGDIKEKLQKKNS